MENRDRALQTLQEEVDELRRRVSLLEQGGAPAAAPLPARESAAAVATKPAAAESAAAAAAEPAPAAAAESDCGDFVAAHNGKSAKTYHRRTCYYAQRIHAGAFYPTREAAESDGRKPCRRCAEPAVPIGYVATGKPQGSKTYHRRSCRYAATIMSSGRTYRVFANPKEAESSGYRVCERCVDRSGSLLYTGNGV